MTARWGEPVRRAKASAGTTSSAAGDPGDPLGVERVARLAARRIEHSAALAATNDGEVSDGGASR